jgi:hypothetical protein
MPNNLTSYFILLFIVSIIGVVRYKKLTTPFKILSILIILTLLLETLSKICAVKYKNNLPIAHVSILTEYVFFLLTYYFLFKNKLMRVSILVVLIIFVILSIINSIFIQPYYRYYPSNMFIPSEIAYVTFSLLLFRQMLLYPLPVNIVKQSVFWFNTAILFYSTTVFFNFGLTNYYIKHHLKDIVIFDFGLAINMIFYLLIGLSILIDNKETTRNNV